MICPECRKGIVERLKQGARGARLNGYRVHDVKGSGIAYCCDGEDWSGGTRCEPTLDAGHSASPGGDNLWSPAAEELVVGTAIAERRLSFIKQLHFWQVEPDTHRDFYDNFLEYRERRTIRLWGYQVFDFEENRTSNMWYCEAICRLLPSAGGPPDEGDPKGQAA